MVKTNVVRLPQSQQQALAPAGVCERYKIYPTIAEGALVWSELSFDVLEGCEYLAPGIPDIPSRPEVAARAQALFEATEHGDLACTKHYKPGPVAGEPAEFPEEIVERRTVARKDLVAWIEGNFPGDLPGSGASSAQPQAAAPVAKLKDELLPMAKVLKRVGFQKATLYRRMNAGTFPRPTHTEPTNRWLSSVIDAYIAESANSVGEEDI